MNLNHKTNFQDGDPIHAEDWNKLAEDVNELGAGSGSGNSHMYVNDKGNLCIETTVENTPAGKKGKINIESKDDLQLKPGDDIILYSSHRPVANMDEVSVKVTDGEDHPVKLQLNTADIVLTTKDKSATMIKDENGDDTSTPMYTDPSVMNITVNSAKNTRGYLKVRAQAIDLRCESHGGISLQPKGQDGQGNMNKIKFEHGGGDGLEFGTFNTDKSSLFTNEYRFNKDGKILLAKRQTQASDKIDSNDPTTSLKYIKQSDDFYDIIYEGEPGNEFYNYDPTTPANDTSVTWGDLVKFVAWAKTNGEGPWQQP